MRVAMIFGAVLMLAACAHLPFGHRAMPRGGETITYSFRDSALCDLGRCRSYTVTLGPDGQGIFTDADGHDVRFLASPQQTRNFGQALAAARPRGERLVKPRGPGCRHATADGSVVDIRWQAADVASEHLQLYSGCTARSARRLNDAVRGLPMLYLPLQQFLGSD